MYISFVCVCWCVFDVRVCVSSYVILSVTRVVVFVYVVVCVCCVCFCMGLCLCVCLYVCMSM